jgi:hypothetical protein
MAVSAGEWLLDDSRISGTRTIRRLLGPNQDVVLVDVGNRSSLARAIDHLCQIWGGAKYPLVPASSSGVVAEEWWNVLRMPQARVFTAEIGSCDPKPVEQPVDGYPAWTAKPWASVLAGGLHGASPKGAVRVALPNEADPWYLAYLATLGSLPESPNADLLHVGNLVETLAFSDVVRLDRDEVSAPGASDLIGRLRDRDFGPPSRSSMWHLAPYAAERRSGLKEDLVDNRSVATRVGPTIAVVYEPSSIADACLIWTLRAIHGTPDGLPFGIPLGSAGETGEWLGEQDFVSRIAGLPRLTLTSFSVSLDRLKEIAGRHDGWAVAPASDLLHAPPPAARPSIDVAAFDDGVAAVQAMSFADQEFLRPVPSFGSLSVRARFELADRSLPPIKSLEHESLMSGYSRGAWETSLQRIDEVVTIQWPSGWQVLERAIRDRGLRIRPSVPGRAALSLLTKVGGLEGVENLLSRPILDRLYQLCERRGISWFRARVRELGAVASEAEAVGVLERIDERLKAMTFRPFDDELTNASLDDFKRDLANNRDSARAWVLWAERQGLLVRGATIKCDRCGSRQWRAINEFTSGLVCRSCGEAIRLPFEPGQLVFKYHASESLLTAVEYDVVPHVLALRWFGRLLEPFPGRRSDLYGGHPGVELLESDGTVLAEVDVLLLMADGSLAPGEVKRYGVGLQTSDLEKLDLVSSRLESPWSFLATPDWAANCPPIWQDAARSQPRRYVLTGEHLLDGRVFWAMGTDPFAWLEESDEDHSSRARQFAGTMSERSAFDQTSRLPGRFDRS